MTSFKNHCDGCRTSALPGVLIFGPVLGVSSVEACPECCLFETDAEAACFASAQILVQALEQDGRWYLDELAKKKVERLIVEDLMVRRDRARAMRNRYLMLMARILHQPE